MMRSVAVDERVEIIQSIVDRFAPKAAPSAISWSDESSQFTSTATIGGRTVPLAAQAPDDSLGEWEDNERIAAKFINDLAMKFTAWQSMRRAGWLR